MMKTCAVLALAIGLLAPAAGFAHDTSIDQSDMSPGSSSGIWDLGVDITQAGSTPANIRAFMAEQPARVQEILYSACQERVAYPNFHQPSIVSFCRTLIGM
jgi:hypothetical protein